METSQEISLGAQKNHSAVKSSLKIFKHITEYYWSYYLHFSMEGATWPRGATSVWSARPSQSKCAKVTLPFPASWPIILPYSSTKWTHWFSSCSYFNPKHSHYSRFAQLEWPSQKLEIFCSFFMSSFSLPAPNALTCTGATPQCWRGPWDQPCEVALGIGVSCAISKQEI